MPADLTAEQVDVLSFVEPAQRGMLADVAACDLAELANELLRRGEGRLDDGEGGLVPIRLEGQPEGRDDHAPEPTPPASRWTPPR